MVGTQTHTQTTWLECVKMILMQQIQHKLFFVKQQSDILSVCGIHHTNELNCNIICVAAYLLSISVLLFSEVCQSVQNVSRGIFISEFITESPSRVCRLATSHSVCGVQKILLVKW
jgi:hypothetical protein